LQEKLILLIEVPQSTTLDLEPAADSIDAGAAADYVDAGHIVYEKDSRSRCMLDLDGHWHVGRAALQAVGEEQPRQP
jgi:hypothetical protein